MVDDLQYELKEIQRRQEEEDAKRRGAKGSPILPVTPVPKMLTGAIEGMSPTKSPERQETTFPVEGTSGEGGERPFPPPSFALLPQFAWHPGLTLIARLVVVFGGVWLVWEFLGWPLIGVRRGKAKSPQPIPAPSSASSPLPDLGTQRLSTIIAALSPIMSGFLPSPSTHSLFTIPSPLTYPLTCTIGDCWL